MPVHILTPRKWRLVGEPAIGEWILSAGERTPPFEAFAATEQPPREISAPQMT
jgi:hypothetical protein